MGSANPKSSDNDVVNLSDNADWQLRLLEARARRAEALKEANSQKAPSKKKSMPWEAQDKVLPPLGEDLGSKVAEDAREMDFHDRVNRFKRISRIQPPRERTPEEIALIETKLAGKHVPAAPIAKAALPSLDMTAPKAEGDAKTRVAKGKRVVSRTISHNVAPNKPAPKSAAPKLGVPDDQPENVFQKTVASVPAEEASQKPIERATTRIIWFSEPEEEKIKTVVAKTVAHDAEERRKAPTSNMENAVAAAKATKPVPAPKAKVPAADAMEADAEPATTRLRVATGLGAIGSMMLAAAAFIVPVGR